MKNLRNSVQLIGRLGANPEVKTLENKNSVARLSIATSDSYKNAKGEKITETQWHNVVAWGRNAEFAQKYFTKGQEIALEGKLVHRSYEDADGNKKYISEIVANEFLLLGSK